MRDKEKVRVREIVINVMFILAFAVVVSPLLVIAKYNYPSADDWSYGSAGYHALQNGEGFFGVLRAALATVKTNYVSWEGRFVNVLFAAFMPGIFGERYYRIVTWVMIGGLVVSELCLGRGLLKKYGNCSGG